jgi:hypothetical protein
LTAGRFFFLLLAPEEALAVVSDPVSTLALEDAPVVSDWVAWVAPEEAPMLTLKLRGKLSCELDVRAWTISAVKPGMLAASMTAFSTLFSIMVAI